MSYQKKRGPALPRGCKASVLAVYPKNWNTCGKELLDKNWYVHYRFYDPDIPVPKKVILKSSINKLKTLQERRIAVEYVLETEEDALNRGWNPIRQDFYTLPSFDYEIHPETPTLEALTEAVSKMNVVPQVRKDFKSIFKYLGLALKNMNMLSVPVSDIKRRHIKMILTTLGQIKGKSWTGSNYNFYKRYLKWAFAELLEYETIEYNPVNDIRSVPKTVKPKELLTHKERKTISEYLKDRDYAFLRYINVFYHSGRRNTELLKVRVRDVYLDKQEFRVIQLKGKVKKITVVPIKLSALPYWKELIDLSTGKDDFVFSKKLIPGQEPITYSTISLRWKRQVRNNLGIKKQFNSLRHLNLDETSAELGLQMASNAAGHTNTRTTRIYTVNEQHRANEAIKRRDNKFA